MTRSRKRKLQRLQSAPSRQAWVPLATALFAASTSIYAQQAPSAAEPAAQQGSGEGLEEIVVTAQKRSETLQSVPISIQVLGSEKLAEMQVASFDDYAKLLPSVSIESFGPGQGQAFFRGIVSTSNGYLHAGPRAVSGMYLDETPITTIGGNPDLHMYDVQRVEALAGPQGTLYGAGSLSGTLRVITNKPTTAKFEGGYDVQTGKASKGSLGGEFEGFVNVPLSENMAVRLVGYVDREGGFIDNVLSTRTYPLATYGGVTAPCTTPLSAQNGTPGATCPITVNNAAYAKSKFNATDTYGGRAALQLDLNDQWVVSPSLIYQYQKTTGNFSYDPNVGDLKVADFSTDASLDHWYQAALTVEGKIGDFELVYSGSYFDRHIYVASDYSQYNVAYDNATYGYNRLRDNSGNLINPAQNQIQTDHYGKLTHEVRLSSPATNPLQIIGGLFYQRQTDDTRDDYHLYGLGSNATYNYSVPGSPGSLYLGQFERVDRDYAVFADATWKINDHFKVSAGKREFVAYNTLDGFFGFNNAWTDNIVGDNFARSNGTAQCADAISTSRNLPCKNVNSAVREKGETHRLNGTIQIDPDHMVYATYSTGFRPGGPNRRPSLSAYNSDKLSNYEAGWKTSWLNHRVRFNGAAFIEKWDGVQLTIPGPNGINDIFNVGNARVTGVESDLTWLPIDSLELSAAGTHINAHTTTDFCGENRVIGTPGYGLPLASCPGTASSPSGTPLPITPNFKGNATARYKFTLDNYKMFAQAAVFHQSSATSILNVSQNAAIGDAPAFTTVDLSYGVGKDKWKAELFVKNAFDSRGELNRNTQCTAGYCFANPRVYPTTPQTFGVKFSNTF